MRAVLEFMRAKVRVHPLVASRRHVKVIIYVAGESRQAWATGRKQKVASSACGIVFRGMVLQTPVEARCCWLCRSPMAPADTTIWGVNDQNTLSAATLSLSVGCGTARLKGIQLRAKAVCPARARDITVSSSSNIGVLVESVSTDSVNEFETYPNTSTKGITRAKEIGKKFEKAGW